VGLPGALQVGGEGGGVPLVALLFVVDGGPLAYGGGGPRRKTLKQLLVKSMYHRFPQ
jgi:hypothetical protein